MNETIELLQNRSLSLINKFMLKKEKKLQPKQQDTNNLHCCNSSPALLAMATVGTVKWYSVFADGIVKVHPISQELSNENERRQYTKILKTWESHRIFLNDECIKSETPFGVFEFPMMLSSILETVAIQQRKDPANYYLKVSTKDLTVLFHTTNAYERDRWMHSLQWKIKVQQFKMMLFNSNNSHTFLKDLQNLITMTLSSPLDVEGTQPVLLRLISLLFKQKPELFQKTSHDAVISVLAPLFEKNLPSNEICSFFIEHCRLSPRSATIVDTFTPIVLRILKHSVDFGKFPWFRSFVFEYIIAISSQNNKREAIRKFVHAMHGKLSICPHRRILNNLVAVCLSAIYQCFKNENPGNTLGKNKEKSDLRISRIIDQSDQTILNNCSGRVEKNCRTINLESGFRETDCSDDPKCLNTDAKSNPNLKEAYLCFSKHVAVTPNKSNFSQYLAEEQLEIVSLFICIFEEISKISDWCAGLATFLQPLPFPDGAMENIQFLRLMYPVVCRFAEDERESVGRCLLYSRSDREGWVHVYSPGCRACEDGGVLFSKMLEAQLRPGVHSGKLKKLMITLSQMHLNVIITLAVRENSVMIRILRDMLQMGILTNEQHQLQAISALRSTEEGRTAYNELQRLSSVVMRNDGPTEFVLAPNSTDDDLKTLMASNHWGCLHSLDLSLTRVTSQSVDVIIRLPNLKKLNLWATSFDDDGLKALCDYLELEDLNLCETNVTDEGIRCLEGMPSLKHLNLNSTDLYPTTYINLKKKLTQLVSFDVNYTDAVIQS